MRQGSRDGALTLPLAQLCPCRCLPQNPQPGHGAGPPPAARSCRLLNGTSHEWAAWTRAHAGGDLPRAA